MTTNDEIKNGQVESQIGIAKMLFKAKAPFLTERELGIIDIAFCDGFKTALNEVKKIMK